MRLLAGLLPYLRLGLAPVDRRLAARSLRLLGSECGRLLLELRLAALEFLARLLQLPHARLDLRLALRRKGVLGNDAVLELRQPLLLAAHHRQLLGHAPFALLQLCLRCRDPRSPLVEISGATAQ